MFICFRNFATLVGGHRPPPENIDCVLWCHVETDTNAGDTEDGERHGIPVPEALCFGGGNKATILQLRDMVRT
jgi:hypothetical protein